MSPSVVSPEQIHLDLTTWSLFNFLPVASVITQYSLTSLVLEGAVLSSGALNHSEMSNGLIPSMRAILDVRDHE
jgi:hypothetical protein